MAARKSPDIANYFSSAKQSQQLSAAETEIQQLKAEIERLRNSGVTEVEAQLNELRSQLQAQSGILSIDINQIQPNPEQPRQTFLPESIDSMCRSLAKDGQLQPVILIERKNQFVLFDGERRWRSAKILQWVALQAVIIPEPIAIHRKALLTSLHREDLNPLDKAEAIVRELEKNTQVSASEIPRILSTVVRRLGTQKRMNMVVELITATPEQQEQGLLTLGLDEQEKAILREVLDLQLNPASVDANIFPMLSLADDLKSAIRELGLKGVHAMALAKLSAKNLGLPESKTKEIRLKTTQQVVTKKLSVTQTRQLVKEVISCYTQPNAISNPKTKSLSELVSRLEKVSLESFKAADPVQLSELQEILRQKLTEIDSILQQH